MSESATDTLKFTFQATQEVSFITNVNSAVRNDANVQIVGCGLTLWSLMLTPVTPQAQLPMDITACSDTVIQKGSKFMLQITAQDQGSVIFDGTIQTGSDAPTPINAVIAIWPLSSAA